MNSIDPSELELTIRDPKTFEVEVKSSSCRVLKYEISKVYLNLYQLLVRIIVILAHTWHVSPCILSKGWYQYFDEEKNAFSDARSLP